MIANFIESLRVMGLGMLGIFAVAIILILIMKALTALFPGEQKDSKNEKA